MLSAGRTIVSNVAVAAVNVASIAPVKLNVSTLLKPAKTLSFEIVAVVTTVKGVGGNAEKAFEILSMQLSNYSINLNSEQIFQLTMV